MAQRGRPRKPLPVYDADAATIREAFAKRRETLAEGKAARAELQKDLEAAGVHAGTLGVIDRLASYPPGKRSFYTAILRRYLDIFAAELADPEPDPNLGHNQPPVEPEVVEVDADVVEDQVLEVDADVVEDQVLEVDADVVEDQVLEVEEKPVEVVKEKPVEAEPVDDAEVVEVEEKPVEVEARRRLSPEEIWHKSLNGGR